jgi:hypothetical protein
VPLFAFSGRATGANNMTMGLSVGAKNAVNDVGYGPMHDTTGAIAIFTGTQPANKEAAIADTRLGTCAMSADAFAASSAGIITANAITNDSAADNSGTPGYAIVHRTADTVLTSAATSADRRMFLDVGPRTLLNGAINSAVTTLTVDDTTYFGATGELFIGTERITYTGKTATTFTGCTRGANGSTAASQSDNAPVTVFGKDVGFDNTAFATNGVIAISTFTIAQP